MKIAVCIFGHMRTYSECYRYIKKHLIDRYDSDVYIHTWDKTEAETESWHNEHSEVLSVDDELLADIKEKFKPVEIHVESQNEFINGLGPSCSFPGLKSMHYSRLSSISMVVGDYDAVITIRPDIMLTKNIDIDISENEILFYANSKNDDISRMQATDIINIGSHKELVSNAREFYLNYDFYFEGNINLPGGSIYKMYSENKNISIKCVNNKFDVDWFIKRSDENYQTKMKRWFKRCLNAAW